MGGSSVLFLQPCLNYMEALSLVSGALLLKADFCGSLLPDWSLEWHRLAYLLSAGSCACEAPQFVLDPWAVACRARSLGLSSCGFLRPGELLTLSNHSGCAPLLPGASQAACPHPVGSN